MFKHLTLSLACLATVNTGFSNTVNISTAVGAPTTSSSAIFLATDEQTMNVTIEVLDADGHVLSSKLVENVPLPAQPQDKTNGAPLLRPGRRFLSVLVPFRFMIKVIGGIRLTLQLPLPGV